MAAIEELRNERLKKLETLKNLGINAYPSVSRRTHEIGEVVRGFKKLKEEGVQVILNGRVMSSRGQGALIFLDLYDGTAKVQAVIKKDEGGEEALSFYSSYVDIGDFIEVTGTLFETKSGQESILVTKVAMLSKSLLPLPDKYHGLQDEELRMRERYLDILTNPELRELFEKKAKFWNVVREFFNEKKFLEVETPTIEVTTGGAEARPFSTHHHDYDLDVYMRISVGELWQKRLMAAGFPKTFEIGRIYRNEGSSPDHVQEFTNCEFYMAYADYEDGMKIVEELYKKIAVDVFGTTKFTTRGHEFDLSNEWKRIDYKEEVLKQTGLDLDKAEDEEIKNKLNELKVKYEGTNRERLMDTLWKYCRKNIAGPAFLINPPIIASPLAKKNPDGLTAQKFQPILAGAEVGNGYSELNDPVDQKERFNKQQELLAGGDEEAMMADDSFIEMLEHGMPPTCGFGFGERLFAFMVDKPIREVQMFPLVKPKEKSSDKISRKISLDYFKEVEIKIGKILECDPVEGSDKLYKFLVDVGEKDGDGNDVHRTVLSGIRNSFPDKGDLIGKSVEVVTNLAAKDLMQYKSNGMLLLAVDETGNAFLMSPEGDVKPGTLVR
ncbi:MAG: lysS [Candidatus Nomurabacteria bacterium]|nr:lysS [Candidatus Nomurabacteria bacterium]